MKMKIKCSWGTIYQQAATGKICVSPHELGEVGRYIYPEDFVQSGNENEWALKVDKSKMIEIEPVYENEIKIKCRCDWAKVDISVAALSLIINDADGTNSGIFSLPQDFMKLDDEGNEWALRENPNKKIKIEQS